MQQSVLSTDLLLLHSASSQLHSSQSKVSAVTSSVDKDNPTNSSNCCENTKTRSCSCECGDDLDEIDSLLKRLLALDSNISKSNVVCEDSCRKKNSKRRELVIDKLLAMCDTDDLVYLNKRVDDYKRDFFALLPLELIERILVFLDWQTILNCCQVELNFNVYLFLIWLILPYGSCICVCDHMAT